MNDSNLLQALGQVSTESASEVFRDHLRGLVRQMISDVMAEEVTELCGDKHRPSEGIFVCVINDYANVRLGLKEHVAGPLARLDRFANFFSTA